MPKYSFKNKLFFSIWVKGQYTTPADPGLPKPPCHKAHCVTQCVGRTKHNLCHTMHDFFLSVLTFFRVKK